MKYLSNHIDELNLLLQFDLSSSATGIKVHNDANPTVVNAVARLYAKKLCTQPDGGYLTHEGIEIAQDAERVLRVLTTVV
jgi:uncharacterized protein (TIGR02647 family)